MPTYYDLKIRCPACAADGINTTISQWHHANCGGKLQIGDDAYIKCTSCDTKNHIQNWRYACEEHEADFRPTTAAHFASAIAMAGQITGTAGKKWLRTLLDNMGDDW